MKMFILLGIDEDSFGPAVVYRHATYFDCYDKKLYWSYYSIQICHC